MLLRGSASVALLVVGAFYAGSVPEADAPEAGSKTIPASAMAHCHAEGGCMLMTLRELERALAEAAENGAKAERARALRDRT